MTGHVFHPGHHELHGITVVMTLQDDRTVVGRFDREGGGIIHVLHAGIHDPGTHADSREDYLRHTLKFGVKPDHPRLRVPADQVTAIVPLREVAIS
jgi:hypothetical protein